MLCESASFTVDGLTPRQTVAPADAAEVARVLFAASNAGTSVVPRGGGTMLDLGAPLANVDLVLSLAKLDRVLDYQPANLTVRTQAGIPLDQVNRALAEHGQCLPLDPPCPDRATLGGILATNASGSRRVRYGSARDLLIGIQVALTNGEIVHGGGQVVKNVAGYDLPKLFTGSLGTLGVIVEATFKLAPIPRNLTTLITRFPDLDRACAVALRVLASPLLPESVEIINPAAAAHFGLEAGVLLALRFGGIQSAVTRQLNDVAQWSHAAGCETTTTLEDDTTLWDRIRDFSLQHPVVLKAGVPPDRMSQAGSAAEQIARRRGLACAFTAHAVGILHIALDGAPLELEEAILELSQVMQTLNGYVIVQHAERALRERLDVWGPVSSDWPIMQKLKEEFDPRRILNPGRFIGGL